MGDYAGIVAFRGVADAAKALDAAEAALREIGLIGGAYDPEAALASRGGRVVRPGPDAAAATLYGDRLSEMLTNGVEFEGPRYFNAYGLGFSDWIECPACGQRTVSGDDAHVDRMSALGMAAVDWCDGHDAESVACPSCRTASPVTDWRMEDPVFLADMALVFWNWPALPEAGKPDGNWWKVDVTGEIERAVGAPAVISGYKV